MIDVTFIGGLNDGITVGLDVPEPPWELHCEAVGIDPAGPAQTGIVVRNIYARMDEAGTGEYMGAYVFQGIAFVTPMPWNG